MTMRYSTPELVVLGEAAQLVLGGTQGMFDNDVSLTSQPVTGFALGLDD
jgi:hypothetical protein